MPGEAVLDAGCGNARFWQHADPAALRPVLLDLSAGMLRAVPPAVACGARGRVQASIDALPFTDARFDCVLANHMLYHVPDLDRALVELRRVLRPGGRLLASTNGREGMRELDALLPADRAARNPRPTHTEVFGLETGPRRVAARFEEVVVHRYPNALRVTDPDALVAYLASMEAAEELDSPALAAIRARVARTIARDGVFPVTVSTGVVEARAP